MKLARCLAISWSLGSLVLIISCNTVSFELEDAKIESMMHRKKLALDLEKQGDLYAAYEQWKIVQTLGPTDKEARRQAEKLRRRITKQSNERLSKARESEKRGRLSRARLEYLRALALDPGNVEYLAHLRRIEERAAKRIQSAKIEKLKGIEVVSTRDTAQNKKNKAVESREEERYYLLQLAIQPWQAGNIERSMKKVRDYLVTYPGDPVALSYLADAHLALAADFKNDGNLDSAVEHLTKAADYVQEDTAGTKKKIDLLKKDLAETFYRNGVRIFRKDIDRAIRYWKQSVEFDPDHHKAKLRLRNALETKKTLKEVDRVVK